MSSFSSPAPVPAMALLRRSMLRASLFRLLPVYLVKRRLGELHTGQRSAVHDF